MKIYATYKSYTATLDRFVGKDAWVKVTYFGEPDYCWIRILSKETLGAGDVYTVNCISDSQLNSLGVCRVTRQEYIKLRSDEEQVYCDDLEPVIPLEFRPTMMLFELRV